MSDPTKLALTGYWRADYPGTSWPATSSAGVSGTTGALSASGTGAPTTGTAQNGRTPADFATGQALTNAIVMSSLFAASGNAGTIVGVYNARALASAAPTIYSDPQLWSDGVGVMGLSITSSGLVAWLYDGVYQQTAGGLLYGTSAYHAFRMRWDGSTLGVTLDNGTEVTTPCGAAANLTGNLLVGENYLGTAIDGLMLEIGMLATTMSDRGWNDYGIYAQERYALSLGFRLPVHLVQVPERVERPRVHPSRITTTTVIPTVLNPASPYLPRSPLRRGPGPMQRLVENPRARVTYEQSQLAAFTSFPDAIDRPRFGAALQLDSLHRPVQPVAIAASTPFVASSWPAAVARVATAPAPEPMTMLPERTSPLASTSFPDAIARTQYLAASQDDIEGWTAPERTSPIASTAFADRVERPSFGAWLQLHLTELSPQAERTAPLACEVYADRIDRPAYAVHEQLASLDVEPAPERTSPLASVTFADRVFRPALLGAHHPFVTAIAPAPERTTAIAIEVHADAVQRPLFGAFAQLASTELSPQPERTASLVIEVHADAVTRPAMAASAQMATTELPPQPERQSPIACTVVVDAVGRPAFGAAWQQSSTFARPIAVFVPTAPIALAISPDAIDRRLFTTSEQLASAGSALPITTPPFTTPYDLTSYADAVSRPSRDISTPFSTSRAPERTAPMAVVSFPDAIGRATFSVYLQKATNEGPRALERTAPLACTIGPDAIARVVFATAAHQAFVTDTRAERTSPIVPSVAPDTVDRVVVRPASQQASVVGTRPERVVAPPVFVDRVARPAGAAPVTLVSPLRVAPPPPAPTFAAAFWPQPFVARPRLDLRSDPFAWSLVRGSYITVAFNGEGVARVLTASSAAVVLTSPSGARVSAIEAEATDLPAIAYARIIEDE